MYNEALLVLACVIGWLFESLRNALINPCGSRVNSTEEASAKYSRLRESAICAIVAASGPKINVKIEKIISRIAEPELSSSSFALTLPHKNELTPKLAK